MEETTADERGQFEFAWLPPGAYAIAAAVAGRGSVTVARSRHVFGASNAVELELAEGGGNQRLSIDVGTLEARPLLVTARRLDLAPSADEVPPTSLVRASPVEFGVLLGRGERTATFRGLAPGPHAIWMTPCR